MASDDASVPHGAVTPVVDPTRRTPEPRYVGRYLLRDEIGAGLTARVFSAEGPRGLVAHKVLRDEFRGNEVERRRFLSNGALARGITSDHVVKVFEVEDGADGDSAPHIVMELGGPDLSKTMPPVGGLAPRESALIARDVAIGLEDARGESVHYLVHRDLKPENILIGSDGKAKIADFGFARIVKDDATKTGTNPGTMRYMSPEQVERPDNEDQRSDIWAVGVLLYRMTTGHLPFGGANTVSVGRMIQEDDPVPPRRLDASIPRSLETIILHCLRKQRDQRYDTPAKLVEDLDHFLADPQRRPEHARRESRLAWVQRKAQSEPRVAALVVAVILVLTVSVGLVRYFRQDAVASGGRESLAKGQAEEKTRELGLVASHQFVDDGGRFLAAGDHARALLAFLRAGDAPHLPDVERALNERRIAAVLAELPSLVQVWPSEHPVNYAAFSPDGSRVVVVGGGTIVRVYDATNGGELAALPHPGPVNHAAWSPDGKKLATAGRDGAKPRNEAMILAGDEPGIAMAWDAETWRPLGSPLKHRHPGRNLRFQDDGSSVAVTFGHDLHPPGESISWSPVTGRVLDRREVSLTPPQKSLETRAAHGLYLAEVLRDQIVRVVATPAGRASWATPDDRPICEVQLPGLEPIARLEFSPDGLWIAVGGMQGTTRVFMATTGAPVTPVLLHAGEIRSLVFSPDGRSLLTVCADQGVRIWDVTSGSAGGEGWAPENPNESYGVGCISSDGTLVAVAEESGYRVIVRHIASGRRLASLRLPGCAYFLRFSPDGKRLITAAKNPWGLGEGFGYDSCVVRWDTTTWHPDGPPLEVSGYVTQTRYLADGNCLVLTRHSDGCSIRGVFGTARVWNLGTRRPSTPSLDHSEPLRDAILSPDGGLVAVGGEDQTARVYETATGRAVGPPLLHPAAVNVVRFSSDGQKLLTGGDDHEVRFWDYRTGKDLHPPLRHEGPILSMDLNAAGTRLAVAQGEHGVRVWDTETRRALGMPFGNKLDQVQFLRNDNRTLLTRTGDGGLQSWDAEMAAPLQFWDAETGAPLSPRIGSPFGGVTSFIAPNSLLLVESHHIRIYKIEDRPRVTHEKGRSLAEMISGRQAGPSRGLIPLTPREQFGYLEEFRDRSVPRPGTRQIRRRAWHEIRARIAEASANPFLTAGVVPWQIADASNWAVAFHYERLIDDSSAPEAGWFMRRGYARALLRQFAGAKSDFLRAAADPVVRRSTELWYDLGLMHAATGDRVAAAEAFHRALALGEFRNATPAGVALLRDGRVAEAERAFTAAIAARPGWGAPDNAYLFRGQAKVLQGKYRDALADFERATEQADSRQVVHPLSGRPEVWLWRALAHLGLREWKAALEALSSKFDVPNAGRIGDGMLAREHLVFDRPEDWCEFVLQPPADEQEGDKDWFGATVEANFLRAERPDRALALLDQAISRGNGFWRTHFVRAGILASLGRHDEALREYRVAIQRLRDEPSDGVRVWGGVVADPRLKAIAVISVRSATILRSVGRPSEALAEIDHVLNILGQLPANTFSSPFDGLDVPLIRQLHGELLVAAAAEKRSSPRPTRTVGPTPE